MSETRLRIKRQIELLGLVIAEPCKYTAADLEFYFDCTEITIKRDLSDLRALGITIHSVKGKGIRVEEGIGHEVIEMLLSQYIVTSGIDNFYRRSLHFFAEKNKEYSISVLTGIQISIEKCLKIVIVYNKSGKGRESKTINPLIIFLSDNEWRLLAAVDGKIKQFLLNKIECVEITDKRFPYDLKEKAEKILSDSFGNWIGEENHKVVLKFTKDWLSTGREPRIMEDQESALQPDGSRIITFYVNTLQEVARWVVARGGEVIVVEPEALRELVVQVAEEAIKANRK